MFFEVAMRRLVVVQPHELGDPLHTQRAMIRRLLQDFNALRCSEEHGYYVTVTTLENVSEGKIRPGTGSVVFFVDFKCITFRPIRNEVVESVVVNAIPAGFLAECGPANIFVPRSQMEGFEYRQEQVQEFSNWRDSSGSLISRDSIVRLKIIGTKWEPKDRTITALGTLNGDLLGHVPEVPPI